jgi:hypothetical protein
VEPLSPVKVQPVALAVAQKVAVPVPVVPVAAAAAKVAWASPVVPTKRQAPQ